MTSKAADKIVDALNQLLEGFSELTENIQQELGEKTDLAATEEEELNADLESALVTELRAAIESVLENEDHSTEEVAGLIATMYEALEEIDPDIFERSLGEDENETEDEYDDIDDDDDDDEIDDDDNYEDDDDEEDY